MEKQTTTPLTSPQSAWTAQKRAESSTARPPAARSWFGARSRPTRSFSRPRAGLSTSVLRGVGRGEEIDISITYYYYIFFIIILIIYHSSSSTPLRTHLADSASSSPADSDCPGYSRSRHRDADAPQRAAAAVRRHQSPARGAQRRRQQRWRPRLWRGPMVAQHGRGVIAWVDEVDVEKCERKRKTRNERYPENPNVMKIS